MQRYTFSITCGVLAAALAGCNSDDGGGTATGTLNIGLTDSPVDGADSVVVAFTGIQLKPAGEDAEPLDPVLFDESSCDEFGVDGVCHVDLLNLTGNTRKVVFSDELPAGSYEWLRLFVDADRNEMDSHISFDDGSQCSLWVPSGAETGLKIVSGITVTNNGVSDYTLDFDVRRSVTAPPGLATYSAQACAQNYILKPAIRIVDTTRVGSIAGNVDPALLEADACRDESPPDGIVDHVGVYVFEDFDAENPVSLDDYDGDADPVASANVEGDGATYSYEVGYLLPGDYRLGLTCTSDVDDVEADDFDCDTDCGAATEPAFGFVSELGVTVDAKATSRGDFEAP